SVRSGIAVAGHSATRLGSKRPGPNLGLEVPIPANTRRFARRGLASLIAPIAWWLAAQPSWAVMDIANQGPQLEAGRLALRITNVGVLGNAFFASGLSLDPSLEFPRGSGHELLNHAELWVGARDASGVARVSGGPMLEWRPTLAADDRVRKLDAGD